ncbi:MAG TPA: galactarate dehydratase, partial [Runella sp.]|nr:galactarate dehydratase [Runella sp.]
MSNIVIKTSPNDNVAIVATPSGLKRGSIVLGSTVLVENIPMGHKVALQTLEMGDEVRRYGQVIGYATRTIEKGSWINEGNISLPEPPKLEDIKYVTPPDPNGGVSSLSLPVGLEEAFFMGYRNADGSV